ncbi:MAG TPA: iron-sulfur cluster assembly protein, partial [Sphingomonas sp.]
MSGNGIMVEDASGAPGKPERPRLDEAEVRADLRDASGREKDYLEGFLSQKPATEPGTDEPGGALYEAVIDALKDIYDPEIPVNIYDLGLVYNVEIAADHAV